MVYVEAPGVAACPACVATPIATNRAAKLASEGSRELHLSLPTVHCAACIQSIEGGLLARDDIEDARVNLTRKRATVRVPAGMSDEQVVAAISALGYEATPLDAATLSAGESDRAARDLAMRLGVAGFAMMNVMLLSVAVWSGAADATRQLFHWLSALIALPTIVFSARPFYTSAWRVLRVGRLNMDVPITLAILLAAGISVMETAYHGEDAYFDAALSLTFFLLAGRYLDQKMRSVARSAATELAAMETPTALRLTEHGSETVPIGTIAVGDLLLVQPGARMPVDGVVEDGTSDVDRSFLTGEADPATIGTSDQVRAGEVNLTGALKVRATAVGEQTVLHALADLVSVAEQAKSRYNSLADRAAKIYAPLVHILAFAAFVFWLWATAGDVRYALNIAVAVLIITCPCALGLAVPAVSTVASGKLFKAGILVKHATALERLGEIDEVVFDKTGTLTKGIPQIVTQLTPADLAIAATLAEASGHPRSKAIVSAAFASRADVRDIHEIAGMGVEGILEGRKVRLGRASWISGGDSSTVLDLGDRHIALEFVDSLRHGAEDLIATLKSKGVPVTLLSGDTEANVRRMADTLGIDNWQAGILPHEKADVLQAKADAGKRVLMVGDGLNDVGALALAHVSIAPASALEATRVAADMVLVKSDLSQIAVAMETAQKARRRIIENFSVAAIYNTIAVPLALIGLASPLSAAIAMSTSSIIVSLNALRLR
ncbi:cadmium-translocating P-type ATPase [Marivivens donghaensis]|uniref:Cadmium-translocating P-type ATPase n=1 Tax=Marivivens donghaensis TaxID=1699413 RepID=A0ABX0VZL1_9RHOB|nr:heavy metal translocating P-type ATPase [Marivivens donghaensis]NIY73200.1 cadmium-translocating P-type ATPase [Marivivens donghaensis]